MVGKKLSCTSSSQWNELPGILFLNVYFSPLWKDEEYICYQRRRVWSSWPLNLSSIIRYSLTLMSEVKDVFLFCHIWHRDEHCVLLVKLLPLIRPLWVHIRDFFLSAFKAPNNINSIYSVQETFWNEFRKNKVLSSLLTASSENSTFKLLGSTCPINCFSRFIVLPLPLFFCINYSCLCTLALCKTFHFSASLLLQLSWAGDEEADVLPGSAFLGAAYLRSFTKEAFFSTPTGRADL